MKIHSVAAALTQADRRTYGRNEANNGFSRLNAKTHTNGGVHEKRDDITNTAVFNIVYLLFLDSLINKVFEQLQIMYDVIVLTCQE